MRITGFDIGMGPILFWGGITFLPILFFISFFYNLFIFWLISKFDRFKIKLSELTIPMLIYTLLLGTVQIIFLILLFILPTGIKDIYSITTYFLQGILSIPAIFFIFKLLIPKAAKLKTDKENKYAIIMSILTSPSLGLLFLFIT